MAKTDAELVKEILAGNRHIFAELVRRYERPVRAVALEILGDYHLAADVSQETFVKAFENLQDLRKRESFAPWLLKIARRYAIESAKQKFRERNPAVNLAQVKEKPNGRLDEEKHRLLSAVAKLPKAEQQVILLHYFSHNSVAEVAGNLDRSVGTVTKQLSRARIRLRKILERSEK